jgi:hypothetical protein
MVRLADIRVGSTIRVRGAFGSGPVTLASVEGVEADIKNGYPGIDYRDLRNQGYWAYLDQVVEVVKY